MEILAYIVLILMVIFIPPLGGVGCYEYCLSQHLKELKEALYTILLIVLFCWCVMTVVGV